MEKSFKYIQILGLGVSLMGALFKTMHWNGANIMLICGLSSLSLAHIIKAIFLNTAQGKAKLAHLLLNVGIGILLLGVLYQLMHWPGANIILYAGLTPLAAGLVMRMAE